MIELIERLIKFREQYGIDGTFKIFTSKDKKSMFITITLSTQGYIVTKAFEYKEWLELSNMARDFELSNLVRSLRTKSAQDKNTFTFTYSDTDSVVYKDFNKKQEI